MSDLDQLDRALEALTRDLAHSPGPGAAAAMSTVRRRRRTRVGAVALAALVVVGGGLAVPRLVSSEDRAAGGGGAPLDAAALERATTGWLSGWEPWERYSPKGGGSFSVPRCFSDLAPSGPEAVAGGLSRFVGSEFALASATFAEYPDAASARTAESEALTMCSGATTVTVDGTSGPALLAGAIRREHVGHGRVDRPDRAERLTLEIAGRAGVATVPAVERVAETVVAGLRSGEMQESFPGDPTATDPDLPGHSCPSSPTTTSPRPWPAGGPPIAGLGLRHPQHPLPRRAGGDGISHVRGRRRPPRGDLVRRWFR